MCGADFSLVRFELVRAGSPPRVRSRLTRISPSPLTAGITSACAEQTRPGCRCPSPPWDHLRVCGADNLVADNVDSLVGSPPRVRSRHRLPTWSRPFPGITSACAEQTRLLCSRQASDRDHLRVCGADSSLDSTSTSSHGSPPRVRSRLGGPVADERHGRITSACAEQTPACRRSTCRAWDHLRVCGADFLGQVGDKIQQGSPPRVRSRRTELADQVGVLGITSACAEQTSRPSM